MKVVLTTTSDAACWDWPDYVFEKDYPLMPLDSLENWIQTHRHLPNVPSEADVKTDGIQLGQMQGQLLRKIEELTLYVLEQNKRLSGIEEENKTLKEQVRVLHAEQQGQ